MYNRILGVFSIIMIAVQVSVSVSVRRSGVKDDNIARNMRHKYKVRIHAHYMSVGL